jgi:hypothetical protein
MWPDLKSRGQGSKGVQSMLVVKRIASMNFAGYSKKQHHQQAGQSPVLKGRRRHNPKTGGCNGTSKKSHQESSEKAGSEKNQLQVRHQGKMRH